MKTDPLELLRVLSERAFLLDLLKQDTLKRDTGRSAIAMAIAAADQSGIPKSALWPFDQEDLARCELIVEKAPEHLRDVMSPWLGRYRRHIAEGGGLHCDGCNRSGRRSLKGSLCESCWAIAHPRDPWFHIALGG